MGRDEPFYHIMEVLSYFNPRARVGRDFSIKEMPKGVGNFNPRARVGRDSVQSDDIHHAR